MAEPRLLDQIEAFLRRSQLTATAFGRTAVNDPSFVFNLRQGRSPREITAIRVRKFMARKRT